MYSCARRALQRRNCDGISPFHPLLYLAVLHLFPIRRIVFRSDNRATLSNEASDIFLDKRKYQMVSRIIFIFVARRYDNIVAITRSVVWKIYPSFLAQRYDA